MCMSQGTGFTFYRAHKVTACRIIEAASTSMKDSKQEQCLLIYASESGAVFGLAGVLGSIDAFFKILYPIKVIWNDLQTGHVWIPSHVCQVLTLIWRRQRPLSVCT